MASIIVAMLQVFCRRYIREQLFCDCEMIFIASFFALSRSLSLRSEMRPQFFAIQFHYLRFVLCLRWLSHSRYMPDVLHFNYFEKS